MRTLKRPQQGLPYLAAIMLKMGGYGFLRFSLPITPDASARLDGFMITISLIAVVYIGFVALAQTRYEETHCVLVDIAYGLCNTGYIHRFHSDREG